MPTELESSSITFTDEAEIVLRKLLSRFDRQVRSRAVEEAVRRRGVPAEITGSDVQRAFNRLMFRGLRTERERVSLYPGESALSRIEIHEGGASLHARRKSLTKNSPLSTFGSAPSPF